MLQKIVDSQNHYVIKVKGNQAKSLASIKQAIETSEPVDSHTSIKKNRGRNELRTTTVQHTYLQVGCNSQDLI